ncbi:MAG TPA: two-component system response regulator [Bacteroidales bacterium]|jgi:two-component system chemotaxis response regulator CheY|nr:two-component system response regulator [Bacteroidales bacterium]
MKKTIVIVDDFENTRRVVEFSLKSLDAEILMAENGKQAMEHFNGRKVDLLITDLNMPVMDGIELVSEIRKHPVYMFIPIIMLTTERSQEKKEKANDVKVTTWMQKPFDQLKFLKIVERCLK